MTTPDTVLRAIRDCPTVSDAIDTLRYGGRFVVMADGKLVVDDVVIVSWAPTIECWLARWWDES